MRYFIGILLLATVRVTTFGQSITEELPEFHLSKERLETQLRFIASDELKGRRTGSPGNTIAARYIASHLRALGYQSPEGADRYFQKINLVAFRPPLTGRLQLDHTTFNPAEDLILIDGHREILKTTAVFAGYGLVDQAAGRDDYKNLDVDGKVVVVFTGSPDNNDPSEALKAMKVKRKLARERGAVGLLEVNTFSYPWKFFRNYFTNERMEIMEGEENDGLLYGWIQAADKKEMKMLRAGKELPVIFESGDVTRRDMGSQNVIGVLEGSDPKLKSEYILITAHYDHVGTGKDGGGAFSTEDSIFNGARDNGMGVVALMAAAEAFAGKKPKRSVIILAVTAEEQRLIGSQYYVENPLIPLEKTVFNLNTDGAGYNTTKGLAVIGWDRTGTNKWVERGLKAFGLEVIPDPEKEQNLFDRSDNVSFARKGVPCLTLSPGFETFDRELMYYYHQVTDEADSLDFDYLKKFCQAFVYTARLIADSDSRPLWVEGDKYHATGKQLYGNGK